MDIFDKLAQPFDPKDIEFRVGSMNKDKTKALALAYVTSRAIMDRLDEVVGPTEWYNDVNVHEQGIISTLTIRVGGEWVLRKDGAQYTNIEPFKGGISDALKRVAVLFGIGRYLYSLPQKWVELDNGRMSAQTIKKLRASLGGVKSTPKKRKGGMSQAYTDSNQQAKDEIDVNIPTISLDDLPPVEQEVISFGDDDVKAKVAANVAKATVKRTYEKPNVTKEYDSNEAATILEEMGATEMTLNETPYGKASSKQQNMCNIIIERIKKKEPNFGEVSFCDQHDTTKAMIEALIDYACSIGQWTRRT